MQRWTFNTTIKETNTEVPAATYTSTEATGSVKQRYTVRGVL